MSHHGLLGTGASRAADLALLSELVLGVVLIGGAWLARHRCYRAHACCQSTVLLLNLGLILWLMVPSFRRQVIPAIPGELGEPHLALAAVHATAGIAAELLGLYILAVAGTDLMPVRLRFTHYKPWMRAALALWWFALLLGVATYVYWYIMPLYG